MKTPNFKKKTNDRWYAFPDKGCYYRLMKGTLMYIPMMNDAHNNVMASADEGGEVDWGQIDEDVAYDALENGKELMGRD